MRSFRWTRNLMLVGVCGTLCAWLGAEAAPPAAAADPVCKTLAAEELRALMKSTQAVVVVNVMAKEYHDDCHIVGSICIPENQVAETVNDWPRNRRIVVYCRDRECDSSRAAARVLVSLGFTQVMAYEGGIVEWRAKRFETEGPGTLLPDQQAGAR